MNSEEAKWHPTPILLPGKSHGWRSLVGCSPWGRWGSDTTERLPFHFSLARIGGGNGNPLLCSCLENPMDWGAWWAAVYRVAQSRTRLPFTFHLHALEEEMATHSSVLAWRIPWTEEPGGLPSIGSHRVGHDWSDLAAAAATKSQIIQTMWLPTWATRWPHWPRPAWWCKLEFSGQPSIKIYENIINEALLRIKVLQLFACLFTCSTSLDSELLKKNFSQCNNIWIIIIYPMPVRRP